MTKYRFSVCKGADCRRGGSDQVFAQAKRALEELGLRERCELYRGGCYGLCHLGPNAVIRIDTGAKRDPFAREDSRLMGWAGETYYWAMTPAKAQAIVEQHIAKDEPVKELFGDPASQEDFRKR